MRLKGSFHRSIRPGEVCVRGCARSTAPDPKGERIPVGMGVYGERLSAWWQYGETRGNSQRTRTQIAPVVARVFTSFDNPWCVPYHIPGL
jgi:hypothetical protein